MGFDGPPLAGWKEPIESAAGFRMPQPETQQAGFACDFSDSGFFVLRTPLLAVEELLAWTNGMGAIELWHSGADVVTVEKAWRRDRARLRERLRQIVTQKEVRQALFIASPSLESAIEIWERQPNDKKGIQVERALVRYFERMSTRPTPFGLFSGCSVGVLQPSTDQGPTELSLGPRQTYRSSSRLDFGYLSALTASLRRDPIISKELRYWPNSSLHEIAETLRYVQSRATAKGVSHRITMLPRDDHLDAAIERSQSGASFSDLVEAVMLVPSDSRVSEEVAIEYVQDLIDNEVVVSSLAPLLTGQPALGELVDQLTALSCAQNTARALRSVQERLAKLDENGLGVQATEYRSIASMLEPLPMECDVSQLYQVDMRKPLRGKGLPNNVVDALKEAAALLFRVGESRQLDELRRFRESFEDRYGLAWVPLLEALDPEVGIGFGPWFDRDDSPLFRRLVIAPSSSSPVDSFRSLLFQKIRKRGLDSDIELVLEPFEIPGQNPPLVPLPDSFCITASVVAPSFEAVDQGQFALYVKCLGGPSGAPLLGRFCHADSELRRHLENHLKEEEDMRPDVVYAEVVHSPVGRIGNVLCRPVFRNYEICYLGRSGAAQERQLKVTDLLVSVQSGEIVVYSKALSKRVIPRLANAHGLMNPGLAPVYRFLGCLQHQYPDGNLPFWGWGPLEGLDFLPRLRVGRIVLSCARWRISAVDVRRAKQAKSHLRFVTIQELRDRRRLPRWVVLTEMDNSLAVDLDNPLSVDAFVHALKYDTDIILTEMYPSNEETCISGPEGHFHHELVIPFVRHPVMKTTNGRQFPTQEKKLAPPILIPRATRSLPLGSDWLFVKLYGGSCSQDDALVSIVAPLVRTALESRVISRWFFVRYADPHPHLRLRFNGPPDRLIHEFLPRFHGFHQLLVGGKIWKIQFDTYEREIERYGGVRGVLVAEDIFFADSEAVTSILPPLLDDGTLNARWQVAAIGMDKLLSDFGFDLRAKLAFVKQRRDLYAREFSVDTQTKQLLGEKYRKERSSLQRALAVPDQTDLITVAAHQAFERRSSSVRAAAERLRRLIVRGRLTTDIGDLVGNCLHLQVNRLMSSAYRKHEFVLYDFLYRTYDSRVARGCAGPLAEATDAVVASGD